MFEEFEDQKFLNENLSFGKECREIENRGFWESVSKGIPKRFFDAEKEFSDIPRLTASLYMDFAETGNRVNFERKYFLRRKALVYFTFCEAIDNNGRYLGKIIDILYEILQETSWVLPAHAPISPNSDCLPDANSEIIDLFAAETGAQISFVYEVLHNRFDAVSKNISPYIIKNLRRRVIDCYLERDDFFWLGFGGNRVNNWNPWINSNVLRTAKAVCGHDEMCRVVLKAMKSLDRYAACYPEDGACDEGPMYWFKAGICLMECLDMFKEYSGGKIDLFGVPKVKNTLNFYSKIYVGGGRAVNFADAPSKSVCEYGVLYHAAKSAGDRELINFCADMKNRFYDSVEIPFAEPWRIINLAEANNELHGAPKIKYPEEVYFESTQVFVKRTDNGILLAAKGGNNDESHNHNDIGNFMVFKDCVPYVIDSGNMKYNRDTFSERRYTIWTNRSEFHNLPEIGEKNQHEGAQYKAENAVKRPGFFSVDIQNAYEDNEDITLWRRSFDCSDGIAVCDRYEFKRAMPVTLNFLFASKPEVTQDGLLFEGGFKMKIDISLFNVRWEEIKLTDELLLKSWGESLFRFRFDKLAEDAAGTIEYSFC